MKLLRRYLLYACKKNISFGRWPRCITFFASFTDYLDGDVPDFAVEVALVPGVVNPDLPGRLPDLDVVDATVERELCVLVHADVDPHSDSGRGGQFSLN